MPNLRYLWQTALAEAITELHSDELPTRLAAADDAIFYRLLEIEGTTDNGEERLALEEALGDVRLLRNHFFRFPA